MLYLCLDCVRRSDLGIFLDMSSFTSKYTYGGVCSSEGEPVRLTGR